MLLIFVSFPAASDIGVPTDNNEERYDDLIRTYIRKHTDSILKMADETYANSHIDESQLLYLIASQKDLTNASKEEVNSVASAHLKSGNIFIDKGNYPQALSMYVKGLKLSETIPDNPLTAIFYQNMGNVYYIFNDYEKAIHLYLRALDNKNAEKKIVYGLLMNLITAYIETNDVKKARKTYERAIDMKYKGTAVDTFLAGFAHAMIIDMEGNHSQGMNEYATIAEFASKSGIDPRFECTVYQQMANSLLARNDYDAAGIFLNKEIDMATQSGRLHLFVDGLKQLAMIYGKQGNRDMELKMKERYFDLKDSIFNEDRFNREKNQLYLYEVDKYSRRIDEINREKLVKDVEVRTQKKITIIVCVGALIIALFLVYVLIQKKKLNYSYTTLYHLHEQMREAYHRQSDNKKQSQSTDSSEDTTPLTSKYTTSNLDKEKSDQLFAKIKAYITETNDYFDSDFSLRKLASMVGSNEKYVSQVINEQIGQNFNSFINSYRIATACDRLSDIEGFSKYTIKGIGESVGYKAHSSFVRAFKQIVGMTPSDYQKIAIREQKPATSAAG